jgi:predicted nucleotidyltransferase
MRAIYLYRLEYRILNKEINWYIRMTSIEEIKIKLEQQKPKLSQKYPIKTLGIFGSYARNEATEDSDVDVLVEFSEPVGLEIVDLALELEALFDTKVDLVSRKAIKSRMMPYVERDLIYVAA